MDDPSNKRPSPSALGPGSQATLPSGSVGLPFYRWPALRYRGLLELTRTHPERVLEADGNVSAKRTASRN